MRRGVLTVLENGNRLPLRHRSDAIFVPRGVWKVHPTSFLKGKREDRTAFWARGCEGKNVKRKMQRRENTSASERASDVVSWFLFFVGLLDVLLLFKTNLLSSLEPF